MLKLSVRYGLAAAIVFCCLTPPILRAQESKTSIAELVVRIDVQFPNHKKFGAGILFAHLNGKAWIVTAKHLIVDTQPAQKVLVTFVQNTKRQVNAEVLPALPTQLDVGVISVADNEIPPGLLKPNLFPATIVGDPGNLSSGDKIFVLGHPNGVSWAVPAVPDYVSRVANDTIRVQSNFVTVGHSGGALFGRGGALVGMVIEDEQPFATAIRIDTIKGLLKKGMYGVQLKSLAAQQDYEKLTASLRVLTYLSLESEYLKEYKAWIQFQIVTLTITDCTMTVNSQINVTGTGEWVNIYGHAIDNTVFDLASPGAITLTDFRVTDLAAPVLGELGWNSFSPITKIFTAVTLQKGSLKITSNRTISTTHFDPSYRETKRVVPQDRVYLIFRTRERAASIQADLQKAMQYCASLSKPD
jgi:hypothetical protein